MRLLVAITLLLGSSVHSQVTGDTAVRPNTVDAVKTLDEVSILLYYYRPYRDRTTTFTRREIEELQATDVGDLLQKFEATTMKSYGGLGGLKTISIRSLGSQHSAVCIDGFTISNNQTGQVNLGQLQTDNIEQVRIGIGEQPRILLPVAAQISGSSILIETFENSFGKDTIAIRSNVKYGSFGHLTGYAAAKWKFGKSFVSAYGRYRKANGNYQYRFQNGFQEDSATRLNNDYEDYFAGISYGILLKRVQFRVGFKQNEIDQGLPGAVILYNSAADERLTTKDQTAFMDLNADLGKNSYWKMRVYSSANNNAIRYQDPTFLNNAGGVDVDYYNRSLNVGLVTNYIRSNWMAHAGIESTLSDLISSDSLFARPTRQHYSGVIGAGLDYFVFRFKAQLSAQYVHEINKLGESASDKVALNPYASIETVERGKMQHLHQVWYKSSFRMPSFNELYYNNIGNNGLKPERVDQVGYNLSFTPRERNLSWNLRIGGYFNRVRDKIVATPTKNLFIWSMQNIGKVDIYGADFVSRLKYTFKNNRHFKIRSHATYSFQRSLDVTDSTHPTYKHQIAYIPQHTVNFDVSLDYKKSGFRVSNYFVSKRYFLNENIATNEVGAFATVDLSIYHRFELKMKHKITAQFTINNLLDNSYSYIRSYVMPGRNYLISLSYAFN